MKEKTGCKEEFEEQGRTHGMARKEQRS